MICFPFFVRGQDSGGYDVTPLGNVNEVGPIKNATVAPINDSFKTITERCEGSGISSSDASVCCQPPIYWLNPACPYSATATGLVYDPQKQVGTDEENQAYQSAIDCLGAGESDCANTPAIQKIISSAQSKHDTCTATCENTYQSCVSGCTTTTGGNGDGPYTDATANAAYRAAVQCLQSGTSNCLHVVAGYGLSDNAVSQIVQQAYSDVQNGTVWQSQPGTTTTDQDCVNTCVTDDTSCVDACGNVNDVKNKAQAAAQKALDDWQTVKSTPLQPPPAKPLNGELQNAEQKATQVTSNTITDANGKDIPAQDVLKSGLDDTNPYAAFSFPLKNAKVGTPVEATISAGPPEAFPRDKVVMIPTKNITDGTLEIAVSGKDQPLTMGAPGTPDYAEPKPPHPDVYELDDYARVMPMLTYHGQRTPEIDYTELIFLIVVKTVLLGPLGSSSPAQPGLASPVPFVSTASAVVANTNTSADSTVVLLQYNLKTKAWDELPTEKEICDTDGLCSFTAKSATAGLFALATKKISSGSTNANTNTNTNGNTNGLKAVDYVIGGSPMDHIPVRVYMWPFIIIGIIVFIVVNRRYWRPYARALKTAKTTTERREAFRRIGLWRYVVIAGALQFGLMFAIVVDSLMAFSNQLDWDMVIGMFFACLLVIGPLFGLLTWSFTALYYRFKKK